MQNQKNRLRRSIWNFRGARFISQFSKSEFPGGAFRFPKFAEGWNKRATVFYLLQDYSSSVKDIAQTLRLEPRHFGALSGLGLINTALGRHGAAVKAFEEFLQLSLTKEVPLGTTKEVRRQLNDLKGGR